MVAVLLTSVAIAIAVLICVNADSIGRRVGVMDVPDTTRKTHDEVTPLVGGIAILVPFLVWLAGALSIGMIEDPAAALALMLCGAGVGLIGFSDDQNPISPLSRILGLLVFVAVAFAIDQNLIVKSLNWGSFEATALPAWAYCALLALTTVGIVNANNMADGQNGLMPSLFLIWSLCLAYVGDGIVSQVAQVLALASSVVLVFNLWGRLFLGDCGSYGVTFVLGLLGMMAYAQGRVSVETITVWFFIPVADCLRLMVVRRMHGRSPFAADTDHFHHRLQAKLGTNYGLVAYIGTVAACSSVATFAPHFSLVCLIVQTAIYFSFAGIAAPALSVADSSGKAEMPSDLDEVFSNVVPLKNAEILHMRERR